MSDISHALGALDDAVLELRAVRDELATALYRTEIANANAAEGVLTELQAVWPLLRGCEHDFDPECSRCQWLLPLTEALTAASSGGAPLAHTAEDQA